MLQSARLVVRPVRADDAGRLYEIRQLVAEFQGLTERTLDETRAMYAAMEGREPGAQPGWFQFVVETGGRTIGDFGVNFGAPVPQQAEIGYSMHPEEQGKGFATEGLGLLLRYLFEQHRLHRVSATTGADNPASQRLLEHHGFRREAHYVESWFRRDLGRWTDDYGYALLARELRERSPSLAP